MIPHKITDFRTTILGLIIINSKESPPMPRKFKFCNSYWAGNDAPIQKCLIYHILIFIK